jgi:hypothetical protein
MANALLDGSPLHPSQPGMGQGQLGDLDADFAVGVRVSATLICLSVA